MITCRNKTPSIWIAPAAFGVLVSQMDVRPRLGGHLT